jgi:thioredoxin reductase
MTDLRVRSLFIAGGVPAVGERALVKKGLVLQHIPDPSRAAEKYLGKRVCVVGSGASAITTINALDRLACSANSTIDLVWVRRCLREDPRTPAS